MRRRAKNVDHGTTKDVLSNVGDELANPTPDENGEVSAPRDAIAYGMDAGFGAIDKGLAFFGDKDAQERVNQRERGEIGYQSQPKIETPKNAKDLANFAENAPQPNKPIAQLPNSVEKPQPNKAQSSQPIKNEKPQNKTAFSDGVKGVTQKGIDAIVNVATLAQNVVKDGVGVNQTEFTNSTLHLSKQDIEDLIKVTSTEVVPSLKGEAFTKQTQGVVDTILNRVVSGKWGKTVRDVANANRQFTKITGPKSYKTKTGKVIKLNPYGSVQNMPTKHINPKVKAEVMNYLEKRANGQKSSVGGHLNYANPYVSDMKNRKAWVDAFYKKAVENNLVFGSGKNVHGHGTTNDLKKFIPKPFNISLNQPETKTNYINDRKNLFSGITFQNIGAPVRNPEKSHINSINSKMSASNVTIHQEFKTDMTINGAKEPIESANAVKRQQENSMAVMARNAKGFIV